MVSRFICTDDDEAAAAEEETFGTFGTPCLAFLIDRVCSSIPWFHMLCFFEIFPRGLRVPVESPAGSRSLGICKFPIDSRSHVSSLSHTGLINTNSQATFHPNPEVSSQSRSKPRPKSQFRWALVFSV
jgi:hypothetical protein